MTTNIPEPTLAAVDDFLATDSEPLSGPIESPPPDYGDGFYDEISGESGIASGASPVEGAVSLENAESASSESVIQEGSTRATTENDLLKTKTAAKRRRGTKSASTATTTTGNKNAKSQSTSSARSSLSSSSAIPADKEQVKRGRGVAAKKQRVSRCRFPLSVDHYLTETTSYFATCDIKAVQQQLVQLMPDCDREQPEWFFRHNRYFHEQCRQWQANLYMGMFTDHYRQWLERKLLEDANETRVELSSCTPVVDGEQVQQAEDPVV